MKSVRLEQMQRDAQLAREGREWLGIVLAVALPLLAVVAHWWSSR